MNKNKRKIQMIKYYNKIKREKQKQNPREIMKQRVVR